MRWVVFFGIFLFTSFWTTVVGEQTATLIENMANVEELPKKFRATDRPIDEKKGYEKPNLTGLEQLHASGSGQFSEKSLQAILKKLHWNKPIYIVDLRQECHGFLNGVAVSWYAKKNWGNLGKSLSEIVALENKLLEGALKDKDVTVYKVILKNKRGMIDVKTPIRFDVSSAMNEQQVVEAAGQHYLRIPIADHTKPSDECVDAFIRFVKELPGDAWVHIHCAAGAGRSTTFMVMYDMMRNAKSVSLEDIVNRQWMLGGLNLNAKRSPDSWKYESLKERWEFIKKFYQYCKENQDGFQQLWSDYKVSKP